MTDIKRPSPLLHRRSRLSAALPRNTTGPDEKKKRYRRRQRKETALYVKITDSLAEKGAKLWVA
ncbi:hypothetical protein N7448_003213 [Penicillium atrosanguineum]|nr:hypothetical protein N7448_003213 [Penicillium atrosanguineum]